MKYGFNAFTDEAWDKLEELGIKYQRREGGVDVYSEDYDSVEENFRERMSDTGLVIPALPDDMRKAYASQGSRHWKHPDTGRYYYLWKGYVFMAERRVKLDHRTKPPTQFDFLILDTVLPQDQDRWRDKLMQFPPNADTAHGGVLI